MVTAGDVRDLVEERPDLEPAVRAVLDPDAPWTFDDVAVDSGAFGELVSRGVVEKTEAGYRVADREAVERALAGEVESGRRAPELALPSLPVTRLELAFLLGTLALVAAFRLFSLPNVYHGGHVVLSSNDPYFYRYWVGQLLTDPGVTPGTLPSGVAKGEPLMVTSLWLLATALGGTASVASSVMAWYPVVSAVVTGALLYALAVVVTDDRRIGLAAVTMLAVVPGHAIRTSLGFADHSPFDYPWLVLVALAIVVLVRETRREEPPLTLTSLAATLAIAIGVAGQSLAWDNSPILLVPLGLYLAADALRAVHDGSSPLRTGGPVVLGVAFGAGLTWLVHDALGWHTTLVVSAPFLVAIGGAGVIAVGELVHRLEFPAPGLAVIEVVGLVGGALALQAVRPEYWSRLVTGVQSKLLADKAIAETSGLFAKSGGWLTLLGFALFLAVPYLGWATFRARNDGRWLPPATYAWYFLALSTIQVRFVGELAPFLALFAGLGLVHLAERIDVARRPTPFTDGDSDPPALVLPEPRQVGSLVLLFLLVASLGIVQVPVKTGQVATPTAQSETAFWMADYSAQHDASYPSNYVFSQWGWNRMYNYFVNGQSRSYSYAQAHFQDFVHSTDPVKWYDRLGKRRGFVVTTPDVVGDPHRIGTRLQQYDGAASPTSPALAHYRLVHVTDGGALKVFTVVPGATIEGTAEPNATVSASTTVHVSGESFEYRRRTTANADGNFSVRLAQPGQYRIGNRTVSVPESAVRNGTVVELPGGAS